MCMVFLPRSKSAMPSLPDTIPRWILLNRPSRVEPYNLLTLRMYRARQDSHLGWSAIGFRDAYAAEFNSKLGKIFEKGLSLRVIAHNSDGNRLRTKRPKIVNCVRAATGNDLRLSMIEDEHRRLPRNSGNLAVHEHVGNEIAKNDDSFAFEAFDNRPQAAHARTPLRIESTACIKFWTTRSG